MCGASVMPNYDPEPDDVYRYSTWDYAIFAAFWVAMIGILGWGLWAALS